MAMGALCTELPDSGAIPQDQGDVAGEQCGSSRHAQIRIVIF